jgi:enediyne biosynthesis protein E5
MVSRILERARAVDARWYQIAVLGTLLVYGLSFLEFEIGIAQVVVTIGTAVAVQLIGSRAVKVPFDAKSAFISSLSLCLLLRTNHLELAALASAVAVGSKFLLRFNGKHVFNPTNFALIALVAVGAPVWVSPGQWGNIALFGFLMASLGTIVVTRAARVDVTVAFLVFWCVALFGRSLWLGEPLTIPFHRLQSGALILFAFFMITDPKTTPNSRIGRVIFCSLVATGAYWVQFKWFRTNGLLWSLCVFSMAVPLIDKLIPGARFVWQRANRQPEPLPAE